MKTITRDIIKKIADLIKIRIEESAIKKYELQLNTVLRSLIVINEIDTSNISITSHITGMRSVMKEDKVGKSLTQSEALQNCKERSNGYFIVKKVL